MAYQIKCDEYLLYDPRLEEMIVYNPKCKLGVNTVGGASFSIYATHPNYGCMQKLRSIFEILQDGEPIFRGRMTEDTRDFDNTKAVDLEGVLAFFNDSIIRPFKFPEDFLNDSGYIAAANSGNVIQFFLKWLIDTHNSQVQEFQRFKLGKVTVYDPNNYLFRENGDYASTWETLKSKLFDSTLGGYLCIRYEADGNYIDYLKDFEFVNKQPIKYGENLLDLSCESNASATYSAIIPLGKEVEQETGDVYEGDYVEIVDEVVRRLTLEAVVDGQSIPDGNITTDIVKKGDTLYSKSAVERYGWIYAPVSETTWDDVTTLNALKEKGVDFLTQTATMLTNTITIKAVDLHFSDEEIEAFRICGYVPLLSKPHDQEDSLKLTELDIDIQNPQNTVITLGEIRLSLTDINANIKRRNEQNMQNIIKIISASAKRTIVKTTVNYYLSTSATELAGGSWSETPPEWVDGRYYWQKIIATYADGTTSEGSPVCITGGKGETGAGGETGVGVSGIATQFYLSTSKTTQSGGSWVATMPEWSSGKYLWTRSLITYTDGSSEYTSPICDSSWEVVNEVKKELQEEFTSKFEQFADEITLEVSGSLGSKAVISITAGGVEHQTELELSKVREAFANDNTAITVSAGVITFNSGTIVINSDNFKVTSSGKITATSGTLGGWTIDTNSLYLGTSFSSASAFFCTGSVAEFTISGHTAAGWVLKAGSNFGVTKSGGLYCSDAHMSGEFITESSDAYGVYRTEISDGHILLHFDDELVGSINTRYFATSYRSGLNLEVKSPGQYIMFTSQNEELEWTIDYYLNNGFSTNYPDWKHVFQTSAMFLGDVCMTNPWLKGIKLQNDLYIKSYDSSNDSVGAQMLGFNSSNSRVDVGSSSYTTMLRGKTVYLNNTSTTVTSDRNAKNNIESLPEAYETFIDALDPVRFKYNEGTSGRYHVGYIAQDVEAALTAAGLNTMDFAGYVDVGFTGELGLSYDEFIALLHLKIKRLEQRIATFENKYGTESVNT